MEDKTNVMRILDKKKFLTNAILMRRRRQWGAWRLLKY